MREIIKRLVTKVNRKAAGPYAVLSAAYIAALNTVTFCIDNVMNSMAEQYIYPATKWGGAIFVALGIAQAVKGYLDASGGQEQPGTMGKAIGKIAIGVVLLLTKTVVTAAMGFSA